MKKKILLVEPRGRGESMFVYQSNFPLMGPVVLGTILKAKGHETLVYSESMVGSDVPDALLAWADVLSLSLLTLTSLRGYRIARRYRELNPKGVVVLGGIHPSFMPEEALEYADYVFCGEGEEVFPDFLEFGSDEKIITGGKVSDMDSLPIPDWTIVAGFEKVKVQPVMTSRGCPYDCSFCTVTAMFGRKFRMASPERVLEELKRTDKSMVFFYDDNMVASPARMRRIAELMIESNLKIKWYAQMRADASRDPELLRLMHRSGLRHAFIGFESVSDATLEEYNKQQSAEQIKAAIKAFHEAGVGVHGMFVYGSDADTPDIFGETLRFCRDARLDTAQFAALTPFPGTRLYEKLQRENRILHSRWDFYDGLHVVFKPRNMSPVDLQQGVFQSFQDFYSLIYTFGDALDAVAVEVLSFFRKKAIPGVRDAIIRAVVRSSFMKWKRKDWWYLDYLGNFCETV